MLVTMVKLRFAFIKVSGVSYSAPLSETLSPWHALKVRNLLVLLNSIQTYITGLALTPWGVLAEGRIRTDAEDKKRRETGELGRNHAGRSWERSEEERKISAALEV